jgi:hypothetical protein
MILKGPCNRGNPAPSSGLRRRRRSATSVCRVRVARRRPRRASGSFGFRYAKRSGSFRPLGLVRLRYAKGSVAFAPTGRVGAGAWRSFATRAFRPGAAGELSLGFVWQPGCGLGQGASWRLARQVFRQACGGAPGSFGRRRGEGRPRRGPERVRGHGETGLDPLPGHGRLLGLQCLEGCAERARTRPSPRRDRRCVERPPATLERPDARRPPPDTPTIPSRLAYLLSAFLSFMYCRIASAGSSAPSR